MAEGFGPIDRFVHGLAMRRWGRALSLAATADLTELRRKRGRARGLRQLLDEFIHRADRRLSMPRAAPETFARPARTDWSCRLRLWCAPLAGGGVTAILPRTQVSDGVVLFHDGPSAEVALRQIRNTREQDLAPYGLRIEVFHFEGSFISLVLDLPPEACVGLKKKHLLRVDAQILFERPIQVMLRLNVRCGPNTETLTRDLGPGEHSVEFDLAYADLNERRIDAMWLDLILDRPAMNAIAIRDLTICRHPRTEL